MADWSQKLSYFQASGEQVGKDKLLKYDPCTVSYFGRGEFMLMGGSNKAVHLWTADGLELGKICARDGWIWSCKARPNENQVIVGSADGSVAAYKLDFKPVYGIFNDQYAFRQNMTEVIIHNLNTNQKARIKCKDCIKQIAVYKDVLVVQLSSKIYIYELFLDEETQMHYRVKYKILKSIKCDQILATSLSLLFYTSNRLVMISYSGELLREWKFESEVGFAKVVGGAKGKESLLVGLKDGHILKVFVDNSFPISLIHHKFSVKVADLNCTGTKLAVVDEGSTCSVYELVGKELLYQEQGVSRAVWSSDLENSICFSGNSEITVKVDSFTAHQQRLAGRVIGFQQSKAYCLEECDLKVVDIPSSVAIDRFIDRGDYESAFKIACAGATDLDWRKLGVAAMQKLSLGIAKKAFLRIKDHKSLEATIVIEKMRQEGVPENDLFFAQVAAYSGNYSEVLKYLT